MFAGRVALVTGATRGIGRAVAESLGRAGCKVLCCGRTLPVVSFPNAVPVTCPDLVDLSFEGAAEFVRGAVKLTETGRIDYVVHAAGITRTSLLLRTTEKDLDRLLHVNVYAPLALTRAVLQHGGMLRSPTPTGVVFVGSVVGERGAVGLTSYAASKGALVGAARSLAKEFGGRGVRVNVVSPGFVDTDMTRETVTAERKAKIVEATCLGRLGYPEEVADVVTAVLGCTYMTGQVINVDGGLAL